MSKEMTGNLVVAVLGQGLFGRTDIRKVVHVWVRYTDVPVEIKTTRKGYKVAFVEDGTEFCRLLSDPASELLLPVMGAGYAYNMTDRDMAEIKGMIGLEHNPTVELVRVYEYTRDGKRVKVLYSDGFLLTRSSCMDLRLTVHEIGGHNYALINVNIKIREDMLAKADPVGEGTPLPLSAGGKVELVNALLPPSWADASVVSMEPTPPLKGRKGGADIQSLAASLARREEVVTRARMASLGYDTKDIPKTEPTTRAIKPQVPAPKPVSRFDAPKEGLMYKMYDLLVYLGSRSLSEHFYRMMGIWEQEEQHT